MFDTDSKNRKGYYFISDNDAHFTTGLILGAGSILLSITLIFLVFTVKVLNKILNNNNNFHLANITNVLFTHSYTN